MIFPSHVQSSQSMIRAANPWSDSRGKPTAGVIRRDPPESVCLCLFTVLAGCQSIVASSAVQLKPSFKKIAQAVKTGFIGSKPANQLSRSVKNLCALKRLPSSTDRQASYVALRSKNPHLGGYPMVLRACWSAATPALVQLRTGLKNCLFVFITCFETPRSVQKSGVGFQTGCKTSPWMCVPILLRLFGCQSRNQRRFPARPKVTFRMGEGFPTLMRTTDYLGKHHCDILFRMGLVVVN